MNTNNISLLFIEDDKSLISEITSLLKSTVSKVYFAQNTNDGLDIYQKEKPDLIITSLFEESNFNGLKLSEKIKEDDPESTIIILSNTANSELLIDAIDIGITSFITKPITMDKLFEKIEKNIKLISNKKQKNESGLQIKKKQILKRFSIDKKGQIYRVEFYKDKKFAGMILVNFNPNKIDKSKELSIATVEENKLTPKKM